MLDEQHKADKRDSTPLLPGEKPPTLPPLTEIPNPAASSAKESQSAQPPQESK
jgi:hypothetical protein